MSGTAPHGTNPLADPYEYHSNFHPVGTVDWTDRELAKITRLKLLGLGDFGCPVIDVSYCHGVMKDGSQVLVSLGDRYQFPRRSWKSAIIDAARADRVFAKGLGLFDAVDIM